jgi:hypothetical protein
VRATPPGEPEGSAPAATGPHVPAAKPFPPLHASQLPVHALLQQYPSTQKLLMHWSLAVHFVPLAP